MDKRDLAIETNYLIVYCWFVVDRSEIEVYLLLSEISSVFDTHRQPSHNATIYN